MSTWERIVLFLTLGAFWTHLCITYYDRAHEQKHELKIIGNADNARMDTKKSGPVYFRNIYFEVWSDVKESTPIVHPHAD